jgi:pyruvate/2-oxoglutarate dehydrogenase complex dihydrolipoamide dehydrogenase (E3) component
VKVGLGTQVTGVKREGEDVTASLSTGIDIQGTEILIATGRKAKTTGMNLESLGLPGGTVLATDDTMLVTRIKQSWLYAVGDTNGIAPRTHMGKYLGKIDSDSIVARANDAMEEKQAIVATLQYALKRSITGCNTSCHLFGS